MPDTVTRRALLKAPAASLLMGAARMQMSLSVRVAEEFSNKGKDHADDR